VRENENTFQRLPRDKPIMPRSKPRLSVTTGVPTPAFKMSSLAWVLVEDQYGYKLALDTRKQIENATLKHLWLDQMERGALPQSSADDLVCAAQKSAQTLLEQLNALNLKPIFDPDQVPGDTVREVRDKDAKYLIVHLLRSRLRLPRGSRGMACTRFRRHRVRCFDGTGGGSWRDGSSHASSSLRLCG
jgi:hypothetical protein